MAAEISDSEKTLKREVSYTVLSPSDLERKLERHDLYLTNVGRGGKVERIGQLRLDINAIKPIASRADIFTAARGLRADRTGASRWLKE